MTFDELPTQVKLAFETEKENADYFLFCSLCEDYSMIYKSETF